MYAIRFKDLMAQDLPIVIDPTSTHTLTDSVKSAASDPSAKLPDMAEASQYTDLHETVADGKGLPSMESSTVSDSYSEAAASDAVEEEQSSKGRLVQVCQSFSILVALNTRLLE